MKKRGRFPRDPKWPDEPFKRNELPRAGPIYFIITMVFVFFVSGLGGFAFGLYLFPPMGVGEEMLYGSFTLATLTGLFIAITFTRTAFKAWRQAGKPIDKDAGREDW